MNRYDEIIEINKNIETIEEVAKINPFHDAKGKFSSSRGMRTYSANPKTKAGQMAIDRSTKAGYGAVMNVHRESKGENIFQNNTWINSGKKPTPSAKLRAQANNPQSPSAARSRAATNRVKGTMGATKEGQPIGPTRQQAAQAAQQNSAAKPTATQKPSPKPTAAQQQTNPNAPQTLAQKVANVKVSDSQKQAIQPRDSNLHSTTKVSKVAKDHECERVDGKDISKKFDANKIPGNARAIDKVAHAQGWDKEPTVTNDLEVFQKAAVQSNQLLFRSVGDITCCKNTMTDGQYALGGHGGKVYGGGMYMVGAKANASAQTISGSQSHSFAYAGKQMMATLQPGAKIATPDQARKLNLAFRKMSDTNRAKFGYDIGAYIASKGYDGAQWHDRNDPYITLYNKSALIFYGGVTQ